MPSENFNLWIKDKTKISSEITNNGECVMSNEVMNKQDSGSSGLIWRRC